MDFHIGAYSYEIRVTCAIMTNMAQLVFPLMPCTRREQDSLQEWESWMGLVTVETMLGGQNPLVAADRCNSKTAHYQTA